MYVERDKAIKALIGWETEPTDEDIEYTLNEIPAADVAPVVHGEVEMLTAKERVEVDCMCKACGTRMRTDDNYCPNCGADMRGANHE